MLMVLTLIQGKAAYAAISLNEEHLRSISTFATDICETAPIDSSQSEVSLDANGKLELSNLLKSLFGITAEGELKWRSEETRGVLQKDLAKVIISANECRLEVLEFLKASFSESSVSSVTWKPVFSPKRIELLPSCSEKNVVCEFPDRRDFVLYGYTTTNVVSSQLMQLTYPAYIGDIITSFSGADIALTFKYHRIGDDEIRDIFGIDPEVLTDVQVCFCPDSSQ